LTGPVDDPIGFNEEMWAEVEAEKAELDRRPDDLKEHRESMNRLFRKK
jgi:hypothetical protein